MLLRDCALLYALQLEQPTNQTKLKEQLEVVMDQSESVRPRLCANFTRLTELCSENRVIVLDHGTENTQWT